MITLKLGSNFKLHIFFTFQIYIKNTLLNKECM